MSDKKHLVAVYGSLRRGMGNHRLLERAQYEGTCFVSGFEMYSLGGFPFIRPDNDKDKKVFAELYKVSDNEFARLDMLEGYPHFYNRKQIQTPDGAAWIYFIDQVGDPSMIVEDGDWVRFKKGSN